MSVTLRPPSAEEQSKGHLIENAFCDATSTVTPSDRVAEVFDRIIANEILPEGADEWAVSSEYTGPNGTRIRLPGPSGFPESFQSFLASVHDELADYARRTISVLRWRANQLGPHDPISSRGMAWSTDGIFWHPAPAHHSVSVIAQSHLRPSEEIHEDVRSLVAVGRTGPLHHDLFREAWEQHYSNPRSAIVIGIAAAEIAVKKCITELVPEAEWLAINLPTPPLVRILAEYLPMLPARCLIDNRVVPPPESLLDCLRKGVTIRNQLSHAGTASPSVDTVGEVLKAIHDLLWLLDFYSGNEWALKYVRPDTRSRLK